MTADVIESPSAVVFDQAENRLHCQKALLLMLLAQAVSVCVSRPPEGGPYQIQMNPTMPWLEHYDHGVPATLTPYRDRTILDCVADTAGRLPNHPAILFKGTAISYGELERLSDACAAALQSLGVARGVRVALLLPNCPQFLIVELAAWKLGAILAPLNPLYTETELEAALGESGAPIAVVLTRFYERSKRVQPKTAVRKVVATKIKDYFPRMLKILFTLFREKRDGDRISLRDGDHRLASLPTITGAKPARVPPKPPRFF